jgi:hypothetical protein
VNDPTQAWPPRGAVHFSALDLIEQRVAPCAFVLQQDTAPGLPQVDREAQRTTALRQPRLTSVASACSRAQRV